MIVELELFRLLQHPKWSSSLRFLPTEAKKIILGVLQAKLHNVQYHADHSSTLAREIADEIKHKLKGEEVFSKHSGSARGGNPLRPHSPRDAFSVW